MLLRIYEAEEGWAQRGNASRSFLLLHAGGGRSHVDHPGWDQSWPAPSEQAIDDLAETGLLRVDPSADKRRTFVLTPAGRERAAEVLSASAATPASAGTETTQSSTALSSDALANPTALVSWAHDTPQWQSVVAEFTVLLRHLGVDADIDLFEQHNPNVDWSTWGPNAIQGNEFVLVVVSAKYRERWEGQGDPTEGAGAAREANTLKTLFNENRDAFYHKVKVVILPGASVQDVPAELGAAAQRFEVEEISASSLEDLLRTLTGQPAYPRPELGRVPELPARFLGSQEPATETEAHTIDRVRARLQALGAERASSGAGDEEQHGALAEEETTLQAALQALTVSSSPETGAAARRPAHSESPETEVPDVEERRMLDAIYAVFVATARWPKFQHVSLTVADGGSDPRDTYHRLSAKGLVRPPIAPSHGFQLREETDVGVSLGGLTHLRDAYGDLSLFVAAARYIASRAVSFRPPSPTEVGRLVVTGEELRLALGLDDRLALSRIGRLIADELPVWQSFGDTAAATWQFEVIPEQARRYRDVHTVIEVLDRRDSLG